MSFITLAVITVLCLLLPFARLYGAICLLLLFYLYPYLTTGILLAAGIAFLYLHRRKSHEH